MISVLSMTNPRWGDADHTYIVFDVIFSDNADGQPETLVARPSDPPTSRYFSEAAAGKYGPVADYSTPEPEPPPVPLTMSPAQLRIGLARSGLISEAEARAWRKNEALPVPVQKAIDQLLSADERFRAEETAFSMTRAERYDPLLIATIRIAKPELGDAEIDMLLDQFFRDWATI